ncbi:hypothetical protein PC9H_008965 [Pleurotus ostreatus]|uniref:Uncharacterized protein n=1 Tax=Pleurotus ostreatus TaxID=5322 RepID=A0A8H6ZU67_PLEOS|nr:uncharacterized protein PC9H_008965 [Pleurotus ostreatus]KAF7426596.1 hypothetical protein PC9H_008965 [Pleurotus ostreatus]
MSSTDKQTALVNQLQIDVPKEKVKAHLQVLGVFFLLLDTLAAISKPEDVETTVDEFFQRSTYRLQVWLAQVVNVDGEEDFKKKPLQDHELPPLDVALALHSFGAAFPPAEAHEGIDSGQHNPASQGYDELKSLAAAQYWQSSTQLKFDAIDSMSKDATRVIECPSCGAAGSVPWAGARGFTSPGFEYDCARCGLVVNHDLLCAGKFFEALARAKNDPGFCLPNTAILVRGELDVSRCASIVAAVRKCLQDDKGGIPPLKDLAESAANEGSSTMAFIANKLSRADALRAERNSAPAVRPKYAHTPRLADVVVALHHQRPFINNVYKQGWSAPQTAVPAGFR